MMPPLAAAQNLTIHNRPATTLAAAPTPTLRFHRRCQHLLNRLPKLPLVKSFYPPPDAAAEDEIVMAGALAADVSAAEAAEQRASTRFAKEIGIGEIMLAVTSRSTCLHCNTKITKGEARVSYFHDTKRPSRWLHIACVTALVKDSAELRDQALRVATAWRDLEAPLAALVVDLVAELRSGLD